MLELKEMGVNLVRIDGSGWALCQVLFANNTPLVADSEDKLQKLVEEFGKVCKRRKLNNSKVMHCSRQRDGGRLNVSLNGEMWRKWIILNIWGYRLAGRKE